jgi:hypothetical protein
MTADPHLVGLAELRLDDSNDGRRDEWPSKDTFDVAFGVWAGHATSEHLFVEVLQDNVLVVRKGFIVGNDNGLGNFRHVAEREAMTEIRYKQGVVVGDVVFEHKRFEGSSVVRMNNLGKYIFVEVLRRVEVGSKCYRGREICILQRKGFRGREEFLKRRGGKFCRSRRRQNGNLCHRRSKCVLGRLSRGYRQSARRAD